MRSIAIVLILNVGWAELAQAQTEPSPPGRLPEIEVEAPRPEPTAAEPAPIPPQPVDSPVTQSIPSETTAEPLPAVTQLLGDLTSDPFDFTGSPFNDFNAESSLATGVPNNVFNTARSLSILDRTRIDQDQASTFPQLLEGLPGSWIQRTNLGGGSVILRGRNGNQNLIMIDGIPINDAGWRFGNVQYGNIIDPGTVERVEVLRGPASVLYGSGATGGVVNIITRRRNDYDSRVGMNGEWITNFGTATTDIYQRGSFSGNYGRLGVFGGVSYLGQGTLHGGQGIDYRNTDYDQVAADLRLDYMISDHWSITTLYQHFFQQSVPRTDRFPEPNPLSPPDDITFTNVNRPTYFDPQQRDFGYMRLSYYDECARWINGLSITFNGLQRREGERETDLGRNPVRLTNTYSDVDQWGMDIRGFTFLTDKHTLSYGTTYIADTVDSTRVRGNVGQPLLPISPILPNDGDYSQFGVFVMDTFKATDWLSVSAGVRYANLNADGTIRRNNQNVFFDQSFDVWVSEYDINLRLTENINWFTSIAEGFRSPNLDDLGSEDVATSAGPDFGTTDLNTERVWNYETGFKSDFRSFQGVASVYQGNYNNLIARDTRSGRNIRANFEGVIRGAEYDANLYLTETWTLFGNMSYIWGENTVLNEPIRVPPLYFLSGSRLVFPRYHSFIEMWGEFAGKQTRLGAIDRSDVRVPAGGERAWQTFNIRGGTDFGRWGQLNLGLYNVFDQAYRVLGSGLNAPGIDFRVGYVLTF